MNRLTMKRNADGSVSQPKDMECYAVLNKLTAYEDTGLEPKEIEGLKRQLEEYHKFDEFLNLHGCFERSGEEI